MQKDGRILRQSYLERVGRALLILIMDSKKECRAKQVRMSPALRGTSLLENHYLFRTTEKN